MSADEFNVIDWSFVASLVGGRLKEKVDDLAVITGTRWGMVALHDNGGELNVVAERPAITTDEARLGLSYLVAAGLMARNFQVKHIPSGLYSLPYTRSDREVSSLDMAVRLTAWLDQEPIDWDWHEPDPK